MTPVTLQYVKRVEHGIQVTDTHVYRDNKLYAVFPDRRIPRNTKKVMINCSFWPVAGWQA